jgi:L-threonylcarbamoyladenylate synthase
MAATPLLRFDDPKAIDAAVRVLKEGGLVAFATDTVYGLGAHAFLPEAVVRLYEAKRRSRSKAIPILLAKGADAHLVADPVPPHVERLAARFWPGPLTLVLPARTDLPEAVTAGGDSVALRVPDHPLVLALISALGAPLAVTSANLSGAPSPVTAEEVEAQLGGRVDLILDGGHCPGGVPSTVVDLTTQPPSILRTGPVSADELFAALDLETAGDGRMRIAVGSDHAGYRLKAEVAGWLAKQGHDVQDLGTDNSEDRVDYPDFGRSVAQAIAAGDCELGIVVCATGVGVCMAANKVRGVRAALCTDPYVARMSRQHNDANVICLGERVTGSGLALEIVASWLDATFDGGRHARRVAMIES